jgi:CheY-like chemotaxis protein
VPVKILVADDSATMRSILEMTFSGEDVVVVTVDSGAAAVQKAQELRPDVLFADASLSPMDGYELARTIKSDPSLASTAVIMLTSQFNTLDEARARSAGVDDHVAKPFDTQVAIDKVSEVLSRPRASASGAAAAPPPPPSGPSQGVSKAPHKPTVAFGSSGRPSAPGRAPSPPLPPPPRPSASRAAPEMSELRAAGSRTAARSAPTPAGPAMVSSAQTPRAAATTSAATASPAVASATSRATDNGSSMADKLRDLGLSSDQVDGVLSLSRDVIERVVWEVVPDLAETIIREEIRRLTAE